MAKEQLQTKSQPSDGWQEKLCVHRTALGGSPGLRHIRASTGTQLGFHSHPSAVASTLLWRLVTQGLEMPWTTSSPKAMEGESWRPVEEKPALKNAGNADHGAAAALPAHGWAVGPTWLTPPESLVHITSFLASPTVVPWKSMPLWD